MSYVPKNWMQTYTGKCFDLDNIDTNDYDIQDIAHALSMLCRFNGHCKRFYSVGEHLLRCSYLVAPGFEFEALMHDASEAYISDMPRPMKNIMPLYKEMEKKVELAISSIYYLPKDMSAEVKEVDNRMVLTERDLLLVKPPYDWAHYGTTSFTKKEFYAVYSQQTMSPEVCEKLFLKRFKELWTPHVTEALKRMRMPVALSEGTSFVQL